MFVSGTSLMTWSVIGRRMLCLECRQQFLRVDFDQRQPIEEGIFLNCEKHQNEVSNDGNRSKQEDDLCGVPQRRR